MGRCHGRDDLHVQVQLDLVQLLLSPIVSIGNLLHLHQLDVVDAREEKPQKWAGFVFEVGSVSEAKLLGFAVLGFE